MSPLPLPLPLPLSFSFPGPRPIINSIPLTIPFVSVTLTFLPDLLKVTVCSALTTSFPDANLIPSRIAFATTVVGALLKTDPNPENFMFTLGALGENLTPALIAFAIFVKKAGFVPGVNTGVDLVFPRVTPLTIAFVNFVTKTVFVSVLDPGLNMGGPSVEFADVDFARVNPLTNAFAIFLLIVMSPLVNNLPNSDAKTPATAASLGFSNLILP